MIRTRKALPLKKTSTCTDASSVSIRYPALLLTLCAISSITRGEEIFVAEGTGRVGAYTTTGATVNANLVTGLSSPLAIAAAGGNLFVMNGFAHGAIGEYTTTGATVNPALISGFTSLRCIAANGSDLFAGDISTSMIGKYTTSGATVNAALITGVAPGHIAVSGSNLFVSDSNSNTISEYTTSGVLVNATLISGLNIPEGIAVSGSHLFVGNLGNSFVPGSGSIGEYDAVTGATINAALITGLNGPFGIATSGSNLFVANNGTTTNGVYDSGSGSIGEYTMLGVTVNAALVAGLNGPHAIAISMAGVVGDYNQNGVVDAADYILWRNSLGQTGAALAADGNNDDIIDQADFDVWRAHFGQTASSGSGASANAAVPEPATIVLPMLAAAGCCLRRGRAA
jgi:hypothetical protein